MQASLLDVACVGEGRGEKRARGRIGPKSRVFLPFPPPPLLTPATQAMLDAAEERQNGQRRSLS